MVQQEDQSPQLVIIVDSVRAASPDHLGIMNGWQWEFMRTKLLRAGVSPESIQLVLLKDIDGGRFAFPPTALLVGMGEAVLRSLTDRRSIDKWQLSPLKTHAGNTFIPTYDFGRMQAQYELGLYFEMALLRAKEFLDVPYVPPTERFLLNPGIEETLSVLDRIKGEPELACDIETGYGQINTVGFAWSPSDAIAINVLPDRCSDETYFRLWQAIASVLESPSRKILQNFIYDVSYFSAYGCRVEGEIFDTMWAMKVLWPELKSNLGNVGRIYTRRPYWKDDGKVTDEEGSKKDWGSVRDWTKHYLYNMRDCVGTLEASRNQRQDLEARGLQNFFTSSVSCLSANVLEMCTTGMPLDLSAREELKAKTEAEVARLTKDFHAAAKEEINPASPKQVLSWLKREGVKLPKKYDRKKGESRESTDASSLKKIRLKQDIPGLKELQQIKTLAKALSSYINFEVRPDGRLSYSLNGAGTETLRMCIRGGTQISVIGGTKNIEALIPGDLVYCYDAHKNLQLKPVVWQGKTGYKKLLRLHWKATSGKEGYLDLTPEHKVRRVSGEYCEAGDLRIGDRTMALGRILNYGYPILVGLNKKIAEHRLVFEHFHGYTPEVIHHVDHNKTNNDISNLQGMLRAEHVRLHALEDKRRPSVQPSYAQRARGERTGNAKYSKEQVREIRLLYESGTLTYNEIAQAVGVKFSFVKTVLSGRGWTHVKVNNHFITRIEELDADDVYDIEVQDCHNFIANEICVHNSGGKDGWGRGFNIQTIPREGSDVSIKSMFMAPEGHSFIEVDLRQAESRFVAYDSADKTLIDMLESGADVHSHVGRAILRQMGRDPDSIPLAEFKATWRQLGKKAGHGLDYFMKPRMFVETVFNELDLVISVKDAEAITEAYYGLFPGIPRWHAWIRSELYNKRKLSTPSGWERYFYGRPGDDMHKEAYAFRPQHTIPWVTNRLMLHLVEERKRCAKLNFRLIAQVHDSLTVLAANESLNDVARICASTEPWHPLIELPGGRLIIPTETKVGTCMATLKEWKG